MLTVTLRSSFTNTSKIYSTDFSRVSPTWLNLGLQARLDRPQNRPSWGPQTRRFWLQTRKELDPQVSDSGDSRCSNLEPQREVSHHFRNGKPLLSFTTYFRIWSQILERAPKAGLKKKIGTYFLIRSTKIQFISISSIYWVNNHTVIDQQFKISKISCFNQIKDSVYAWYTDKRLAQMAFLPGLAMVKDLRPSGSGLLPCPTQV